MMTTDENIGTVLDRMIDDYILKLREGTSTRKPNFSNLIRIYKPAKKDLKVLVEDYDKMISSLQAAIDEKDEELVEAWDFLPKTKLSHLATFAVSVRDYLEDNSKIVRKKRKRTAESQTKKLQFKDECEGVKSINPEDIIGAKTFVCYNCKQRKIYFYESEDGFEIKGTTLQNFDPNKSYGKNFGKSKHTLKQIQDMGIRAIKVEIDKINNKSLEATGRVNSDMILVKVSK